MGSKKDIQNNYFSALADKHRYAQSIKKPKIIFGGGSNLAFGLSADTVQNQLKMPVVNLGLYAGFGLDFMLKEILFEVKKGDIVVLSTEFYLAKKGEDFTQQTAIWAFPPADDFMVYDHTGDYLLRKVQFLVRYARNLIFYPNHTQNPSISDTHSDYFRAGFSEKGDLLAHLNNTKIRPIGDFQNIDYQDYTQEIKEINLFINQVKSKGASVFWCFPSFSDTAFKINKKGVLAFEKQILSGLNCPKINRLADSIFPEDCFYDTHYHLTNPCRLQRTLDIAKALKKEIAISNKR